MACLYPTSGTLRKARHPAGFFISGVRTPGLAHKKARQVAGKGNKHSG